MTDERELLHFLANRVATAKGAIEVVIGLGRGKHDPKEEKFLGTALQAIDDIAKMIQERRAAAKSSS